MQRGPHIDKAMCIISRGEVTALWCHWFIYQWLNGVAQWLALWISASPQFMFSPCTHGLGYSIPPCELCVCLALCVGGCPVLYWYSVQVPSVQWDWHSHQTQHGIISHGDPVFGRTWGLISDEWNWIAVSIAPHVLHCCNTNCFMTILMEVLPGGTCCRSDLQPSLVVWGPSLGGLVIAPSGFVPPQPDGRAGTAEAIVENDIQEFPFCHKSPQSS